MSLIALCEREDADAYERHVARLARRWLRFMNSSIKTQGVVNGILEELRDPRHADYGCVWDDFRARFLEWARTEDWLNTKRRSIVPPLP